LVQVDQAFQEAAQSMGAGVCVAVVAGDKRRAGKAAVCAGVDDGAGLGPDTATALHSARVAAGPAGDLTIDGAGLALAETVRLGGTLVATVGGSGVDVKGAGLDAGVTGLGSWCRWTRRSRGRRSQ
jgi:hypothetical protein